MPGHPFPHHRRGRLRMVAQSHVPGPGAPPLHRIGLLAAILLVGMLLSSLSDHTPHEPRTGSAAEVATLVRSPADRTPVLLAAGDIAACDGSGAKATARLLRGRKGIIAALGDTAYEQGTPQEFARCYAPTWGTEKARTRPAVGNHEYETRGAAGYFGYFRAAAGARGVGYYSYDLGTWHIIVLNSNCQQVGGCSTSSPQGTWVRDDLAAHPARCTLAYWHHPLFSSGQKHGGTVDVRDFWHLLYAARAEVVLSAHEHNYERFAPQDPLGNENQRRGIRAFVVGTGGAGHYPFGNPVPHSEVRNADTYGVLAISLRPGSYAWDFLPVRSARAQSGDKPFTDHGRDTCH